MIELSRDITFGQYINNGSVLTRLDPRTKQLGATLLIVLVSIIHQFVAFALCLLFCILIQRASGIALTYVLRGYRPFLGFLAFITIFQILFYYAPPGQHQTIYWQWWILSISQEGILNSLLIILRIFFLYYIVSMLMFTTSLVDLTDGAEGLLSPLQKLGLPVTAFIMVLVVALKFVPIFITEIERLIKAQTARGVRFDQGNALQRTMKLAPLLILLFISAFKRAEVLSTAMEARCFGNRPGWKRSKRRVLRFERNDFLALTLTLIACVTIMFINIAL